MVTGEFEWRLDNKYWLLAGVGMVNFCYFVACARLYREGNDRPEFEILGRVRLFKVEYVLIV